MKANLSYIKLRIRNKVPNYIWNTIAGPLQPFRARQYAEIDVGLSTYGSSSKYFVIRRRPPGAGLISNVNHVTQGILRAKDLGLIPVVDMDTYLTSFSQPYGVLGKTNAWEYFFRPVSSMTLRNTYDSKLYVLSEGERILKNHWLADKSQCFITEKDKLVYLKDIVDQHIFLNEWCAALQLSIKEFLDWSPKETLGVFLRHDHLTNRPAYHPRQPDIESLIAETKSKLKDNSFRYLFIATEDKDLKNYIASRIRIKTTTDFSDVTLLKNLTFRDRFEKCSIPISILSLAGYLIQTYLFSEVRSCVSSIANGSTFSFILNGGEYEDPTIFNLGVY